MTSTVAGNDSLLDELHGWLADNWDPDLTVGTWWQRLGLAGWSAPSLPAHAYGRGVSRSESLQVSRAINTFGALGGPFGVGLLLAAPTIVAHGTQEQIDQYVRPIVTGQHLWCQLFSEPSAGSDLAGLQTRAERDGDRWIVNGQKVWTSLAHKADMGMLLARTAPMLPKHQGITYFAFEMLQPGVDIRPLREMTGRALFNEVFLTDAQAPPTAVIGGENHGWGVTNTTLTHERAGLGSGGDNTGGLAVPGSLSGDLERRAGDLVPELDRGRASRGPSGGSGDDAMIEATTGGFTLLLELATTLGKNHDPLVRQRLADLYTWNEIGRFNGLRLKAVQARGGDIAGLPNIAKLSTSRITRVARDAGLSIAGAEGMLHAYTARGREEIADLTGHPVLPRITELALNAQAPAIYGGTDQVQRNIIGERILGLPKEPDNSRATPFSELPRRRSEAAQRLSP